MARQKDFTTKDTARTYDVIGARAAQSTPRTKNTKRTLNTKDIKDDLGETEKRFTVVIKQKHVNYLNEKKWNTRKPLKDLLIELIEEDMKKHPDITKRAK